MGQVLERQGSRPKQRPCRCSPSVALNARRTPARATGGQAMRDGHPASPRQEAHARRARVRTISFSFSLRRARRPFLPELAEGGVAAGADASTGDMGSFPFPSLLPALRKPPPSNSDA
eukprot:scaffold34_cov271-Prasinococcus_capsulatus_cf.AAC.3